MGNIRHGPRPTTYPPLSARALRLLHASLTYHELNYLFGDFLKLYPRLPRSEAKTQGVGFEVVCFAAGLKETVLIGWGDGTDEQGDGLVARAWLQQVWDKSRADMTSRTLDQPEPDADQVALQGWMDAVQIHKLGNVQGETAVFTGHFLLHLLPTSPALTDVLLIASEQAARGSEPSKPTILDESVWAHLLDYPAPMPLNRFFYDDELRAENVVQVNIDQDFADGSLCGTEYFCSNTASDLRRARWHFERYSERLKRVVDISIRFNGTLDKALPGSRSTLRLLKPVLRTGIHAIENADLPE
jgi:hypothetical protein